MSQNQRKIKLLSIPITLGGSRSPAFSLFPSFSCESCLIMVGLVNIGDFVGVMSPSNMGSAPDDDGVAAGVT